MCRVYACGFQALGLSSLDPSYELSSKFLKGGYIGERYREPL